MPTQVAEHNNKTVKMASKSKLEDLNVTPDEMKSITEAMKKEEFRKLFAEYAEEISDPENRRKYEEEITMMENERGMNVQFVNPNPGFVIKTTVNDDTKVFINICTNDKIDKPSHRVEAQGMNWSLPHSFAQPREDVDKQRRPCKVVDFVIHPDTYRMLENNVRFRQMVYSVVFDGMDKQFDMKADRKNVTHLTVMKYKGTPSATVIRTKIPGAESSKKDPEDFLSNIPVPNEGLTTAELTKRNEEEIRKKKEQREKREAKENKLNKEKDAEYTTPKYTLKHRNPMDISQYTNDPYSQSNRRPAELVVEVDLPLVESAASVQLDIFEDKLILTNEKRAKYKLELTLPYPVDDDKGSAKFDKCKRRLCITLPVLPPTKEELQIPEIHQNSLISELPSEESCADEGKDHVSCSETAESETSTTSNNDNETSHTNGKTKAKPLVEEVEKTEEISTPEKPSLPLAQPKISYYFPSNFEYQQDDESVSVLINLRNVAREDKKFTFNPYGCEGKMMSVGGGGFPMHYNFVVQFENDCMVDPDKCYVSQSPVNIALTFIKSDRAIGTWEKFKVGVDAEHMEERLFLTEKQLKQQLDSLDQQVEEQVGMPATNASLAPTLEVTEMNEEALTVQISAGSGDGPNSPLGSPVEFDAGIEVIYKKDGQRPRGILKQRSRTLSESSDDTLSSSCGSATNRQNSNSTESPITEESNGEDQSDDDEDEEYDGERRRRHVSFSDHVDQATFKTNASVSSMTPALKSKRRRQRKQEQKKREKEGSDPQQERRRRRSSGSEHSSCEDDQREKRAEEEKTSSSVDSSNDTDSCSATGSEPNDVFEKKENGERTSGKKNKKRRNRKGKSGQQQQKDTISCDSASDANGDGAEANTQVKSSIEEKPKPSGDGPKDKQKDRTIKTETKEEQVIESDKENKGVNGNEKVKFSADNAKVKLKKAENDSDDDGCEEKDGDEEKKPVERSDTLLNWKDGPVVPTQKAVVLNNSTMFDLDMD